MISDILQEDLDIISRALEESPLPGHSILVTGATGLISSLLIKGVIWYNECHENKIRVIGVARNEQKVHDIFVDYNSMMNNQKITFLYQDIESPILEDCRVEYIIHTANATSSKLFITHPVSVLDSIYIGTREVLDFSRKVNAKGIVYVSSMEAFGKLTTDGERLSESNLGYIDLQDIRSCYSEGKRAAELLCKCYAEEFGLPVRIARLAQTFGAGILPWENRVFAQFARSAVKGEDIVLHTRGQSVGNYCYTSDVLKALIMLLYSGENGAAYTVVNEETTRTIAEMASNVADEFSKGKSQVVFDIPESNQFGYAPDTKMRLSSEKLCRLGWKPEVNLIEMYRRMIADFYLNP